MIEGLVSNGEARGLRSALRPRIALARIARCATLFCLYIEYFKHLSDNVHFTDSLRRTSIFTLGVNAC